MSEKSDIVSRLVRNKKSRDAYTRGLINTIVPAQIRALRFKSGMTQKVLAKEAEMKQSRISTMERPGATQFNVETLIRLASALGLGLKVEFVSFSEMLQWENGFNFDSFNPLPIDKDTDFQREEASAALVVPGFTSALEHGAVNRQAPGEVIAVSPPLRYEDATMARQVFLTTYVPSPQALPKALNVRFIFNPLLVPRAGVVTPFSNLDIVRSQNLIEPEGVIHAEDPQANIQTYAYA
jgi:transcriptional regulator with XRE-family HTH domain